MTEQSEMETVTAFYTKYIYTLCPYCGEKLGGFLSDPCNTIVECEYCGKAFRVGSYIDKEEAY